MLKKLACLLPLLWTACAVTEALAANDIPPRPAGGYMRRSSDLNPYYGYFQSTLEIFPQLMNARTRWTTQKPGFSAAYPRFNIGFSYFQNSGPNAYFSFTERLFFADVFDLIRYAVNSEVFASEILQRNFYENDGTTPKSASSILEEIRSISFATSLAKRPLSDGVLAEASVGGYLNIIWVRDDVDYAGEQVNEMAVIILHEITHNLGYSHPSQVNYGVHRPVQEAIRRSTQHQVEEFISFTPYHESLMINRIRQSAKFRGVERAQATVSCSHDDIFPAGE